MTITTSINAVGPVRATEMIQSAQAEAALEHRSGLHTVTAAVQGPDDESIQEKKDGLNLPPSQKRVVDITV
ncbi:hypothetical protein [Methylobacterium sp. 22177]|jgi:hypothetical protein|uniref:hypothetical protein n=1 Tax=Methylobacterium sp. 22177 TaxID=3453885 RepID=UPI003F829825